MRCAIDWKDYELLDTSNGEKLERWGEIVLIRPDPQIIWKTPRLHPAWEQAHARYCRSSTGGGRWEILRKMPEQWRVNYKSLAFQIKTMGFKHTGLFPEQAVNWDFVSQVIQKADKPVKVLNLFAYTGGATAACLAAGADVVHVDASKGMVAWAKENAAASGVSGAHVRWIVDDCIKFVQREIRRGNRYDVIIMDPPSYGRGPGGEVWKLEDEIYHFVELCAQVLSEKPLLLLLNSYTTGLSPSVMEYILGVLIEKQRGGKVWSDEIGLLVTQSGYTLPCGATAVWQANG